MRAIIDEGVPRRLVSALRELGCNIDPYPNDWKGKSNGRLLTAIEAAGYDCLVTCDKNIAFQQDFSDRPFALIVLPRPEFPALKPILDAILKSIEAAKAGSVLSIDANGTIRSH